MKYFFLLIFTVISYKITFGDKTPYPPKNTFKINPFSLLDWHNQAVTIAYERSFNFNNGSPFSWQLEAGAILANYVIPNENYTGIKFRGDIRYYFNPQKNYQFFTALNSGISYTNYSSLMTYYLTSSGRTIWSWNSIGAYKLKQVKFEKTAITINLILGLNKKINDKLYFEIYGGLGTRKTELVSKTPDFDMPGWTPVNNYDMKGYYLVPGKFNYINCTGGMKFCFVIN